MNGYCSQIGFDNMNSQFPGTASEAFAKCNCKTKVYPDGSRIQIICSTDCFVRDGFEKRDNDDVFVSVDPYVKDVIVAVGPQPPITEQTAKRHIKPKSRDSPQLSDDLENDPRDDNVKRAIDSIFDIVMCNEWNYFITGTFNDSKVNASEASEVLQPVSRWLSDRVKRKGLKYLLVPELHPTSGRIHFHGLINDSLKLSDSGRVMYRGEAYRRSSLTAKGINPDSFKTVYNIDDWKFGYSTAIPVDNSAVRLARYVTKYICKDCRKIFGKFYWSSRNIVREPQIIYDNVDYSDINQLEYAPKNTYMRFKYISDFKE